MRKQQGLSLIELMVSITLGLVLLAGVLQMFLSSKTVFLSQQGSSRVQESGRLAMEFIGRDLRMASYLGCVRTISPVAPNTYNVVDPLSANPAANGLSGLHMNFLTGLRGYNAISTAANDKLPHGAAIDLGTTTAVGDVLVIRGANERGLPVNTSPTNLTVTGYTPLALVNDSVEGFKVNSIAVMSDCSKGRIFKVSQTPAWSANQVTLTHAGDNWNVATNVKNQYARGNVLPVHTIVYFVANNNDGIPSLFQRVDNESIELLQGVEDMFITYYRADKPDYVRASQLTDSEWDGVSSVKIELLVRSLEPQSFETDVQPYTFGLKDDGSQNVITPNSTDIKYMRQVFKSTLAVRTRIID